MFDAETSRFLRSAPPVPDLDPEMIPALLTQHYAELASSRLRGSQESPPNTTWPLERIADTYELVASTQRESPSRAAAAFVAATAQQILARRQLLRSPDQPVSNIDRDRVDPSLSAAILFLMAEQYGDANEAALQIRTARGAETYEAAIISEHVADMARGRLVSILERSARWRRPALPDRIEDQALAALLEAIATGIELLAAHILRAPAPESIVGRFANSRDAFDAVVKLAAERRDLGAAGFELGALYPGPFHLASLLSAADSVLKSASLHDTPMPSGSDAAAWERWLRFRADKFPFVWPNHRRAIAEEFHQTGVSAVVVLPTGAGKTTVSSLKIAGVLARGKKVAFLAPTHALVDQLTEDLQEMFPSEIMDSVVSNDFDLLLGDDASFQDIEVMTPERCLAMLSFAPEAFAEVGLLVFDECHLLSPQAGKIRRALDAMLCVLAFAEAAPEADLLLLSAMVRNGAELADWVGTLTKRRSIAVDLLWKPSRQARGVVIYDENELNASRTRAWERQIDADAAAPKAAKDLRGVAKRELTARPYGIWGLQHNWHSVSESKAWVVTTALLDAPILLAGSIKTGSLRLKPNVNDVAAQLAATASLRELKTIVFVNTKRDAVSVAREIATKLGTRILATESEGERWAALEIELGSLKHSLVTPEHCAVPHNSSMLRLERDLAERMFKRSNGANVIVATPTLAQGLNLPAQLAILAGDKRADRAGGRENLEAHEILNAAARAGRAGHLANGLVLLIPEPIITFRGGQPLNANLIGKLKGVLPEDDHCVTITDPLETVLDRLMAGQRQDSDVQYTINRMAVLASGEHAVDAAHLFNLQKSFGYYRAASRAAAAEFEAKIEQLRVSIEAQRNPDIDHNVAILSSQSGLSANLLVALKARVLTDLTTLPNSVVDWLCWTLKWLAEDSEARSALLSDVSDSILTVCGEPKGGILGPQHLDHLLRGLQAWVNGDNLRSIELTLGGEPDNHTPTKYLCPRAREIAGTIVPRAISFILSLVARVASDAIGSQELVELDRQLIEFLGTIVRRGYSSPEMMFYAMDNKHLLGRVQVHQAWKTRFDTIFDDLDDL